MSDLVLVADRSLGLIAALFVSVTTLAFCGVAVYRRQAIKWNIVDWPNHRSSHQLPVPVGAGIVIFALNVAGWVLWSISSSRYTVTWLVLPAAAVLIVFVSALDDLGHVHYRLRLLAHAGAATTLVIGVGYWHAVELPVFGMVYLGIVGVVVTVFWVVGVINAFNFVDGLDGMAAGQGAVAGLGWLTLGWDTHHSVLIVFGALLAASCIGFLPHNWHPARIFMGDVGSTFIGYTLAALPIVAVRYDARFAIVAVLLIWPAIFDSSFTLLVRLRHGESIFSGHRSFLFHRLVDSGWSHAEAALLYTVLPAAGASLALFWQWENRLVHAVVALVLGCLCFGLWRLVRHVEDRRVQRPGDISITDSGSIDLACPAVSMARPAVSASSPPDRQGRPESRR